jgi:hypothetical protein
LDTTNPWGEAASFLQDGLSPGVIHEHP